MTVLNVVQPDEFDPSGFEVVDGKLTPKISSHPDNILEITPDGLYTAGGSSGSVLGRYRYDTSVDGEVIHKGIKFDFNLIDGAVSGYIYGVNPDDITLNDTIYYNGQVEYFLDRSKWEKIGIRHQYDIERLGIDPDFLESHVFLNWLFISLWRS